MKDPNHIEQAAAWKTLLTSGEVTVAEQQAFETWLNEDLEHKKAYKIVEKFWDSFEHLDPASAKSALLDMPSKKKITMGIKASLSVFLAAVSMWALVNSSIGDHYLADYSTTAGEMRDLVLDDGSRIKMNTGSAIDIAYSGTSRLIKLRQGEIVVQVAKDLTRPFIVETEHGTAQALGTQYLVKTVAGSTSVAVIESIVKVCTAGGYFAHKRIECLNLTPATGVAEIKPGMQANPVDVDEITAWTGGYLSFESAPLSTVLHELERYVPGKIYFDSASIGDLDVSGVVPVTDIDRAFAMLSKLLPISIQRYPYLTVVERKAGSEERK
ncbi:FecR family protein [Methylobacillus caricis]|uniref:FecR family protein n=1 Tax=Methylobacillus caricis TaxID=1971611 RepID=UPI001CFF596E|nr:FecR family protein [Methylobacillus caricis]MCB5186753.1 FecR family protein [Methylobacillus caricis]